MNRRSFLSFFGLAPIAAVAAVTAPARTTVLGVDGAGMGLAFSKIHDVPWLTPEQARAFDTISPLDEFIASCEDGAAERERVWEIWRSFRSLDISEPEVGASIRRPMIDAIMHPVPASEGK